MHIVNIYSFEAKATRRATACVQSGLGENDVTLSPVGLFKVFAGPNWIILACLSLSGPAHAMIKDHLPQPPPVMCVTIR